MKESSGLFDDWHEVWQEHELRPSLPMLEAKVEHVILSRGPAGEAVEIIGRGFRDCDDPSIWDLSRRRRLRAVDLVRWRYIDSELTDDELDEPDRFELNGMIEAWCPR